jgi:hypothetical protein
LLLSGDRPLPRGMIRHPPSAGIHSLLLTSARVPPTRRRL